MRGSVTHIDHKIVTLEEKEEPTEKDQQSIPRTLKKLEELKAEFKAYHYAVVEQIEGEHELTEKQTTLDEFEEKLGELIDHLSELVITPEHTEARAPSLARDSSEPVKVLTNIRKRLNFMERNIDKMVTTVRTFEPMPDLDVFLVEQLTKDVTALSKRLSDIVADLLPLSEDDAIERASTLEGSLRTLSLKLIKLAHACESSTTARIASASFGVKLPKISVLTFNGNIIEWRNFWEQF